MAVIMNGYTKITIEYPDGYTMYFVSDKFSMQPITEDVVGMNIPESLYKYTQFEARLLPYSTTLRPVGHYSPERALAHAVLKGDYDAVYPLFDEVQEKTDRPDYVTRQDLIDALTNPTIREQLKGRLARKS